MDTANEAHKPRYCRLLFGPDVTSEILLILHSDSVHVDRAGRIEQYPLQASGSDNTWRECVIGDIWECNSANKPRELRLIQTMDLVVLTLHSDGWGMKDFVWLVEQIQFGYSRDDAPVVHIHGPLSFLASIARRGQTNTLFVRIGSLGVGPGTFACITPSVAAQVAARPIARFEFQGRGGRRLEQRVDLEFDC